MDLIGLTLQSKLLVHGNHPRNIYGSVSSEKVLRSCARNGDYVS